MRKYLLARGLVLGMFIVLIAAGAAAQPVLTSTPAAITISETNPSWSTWVPNAENWTLVKNLVLDGTYNITELSATPPDMTQAGGTYPLAEDSVNATITNETIAALARSGTAGVPVIFQLAGQTVESGKYTGGLTFRYWDDTGAKGLLTVPIELTVKDHPFVPGLILLVSTGVGLIYFLYRERVKPYDEFILQFENFKDLMGRDNEFNSLPPDIYFQKQMKTQLDQIPYYLKKMQLDKAQSCLTTAEQVRGDWLFEKSNLVPVLNTHKKMMTIDIQRLENKLPTGYGKFLYPESLRDKLKDIYENFINRADTSSYKSEFETFRTGLYEAKKSFHAFENLVDTVLAAWGDCKKRPGCCDKIELCWKKIQPVPYGGKIGIADCTNTDCIPPLQEETRVGEPVVSESDLKMWMTASLAWIYQNIRQTLFGTATRLQVFHIVSYLILVMVLFITGFQELYYTNATFGSFPDYAAVILWGFGTGTGSMVFSKAITDLAAARFG